jgi:predicted AlkP superfamily pyrophosphatase or phosphodiesterase
LRLAQNFKNKTIAIAIKDRSSILPGGHSANAAYWLDGKSGQWITSSYYQSSLPTWVADFNNKKLYEKYLKEPWSTKLDIREYDESDADEKWYERSFANEEKPVFPHKINEATAKGFDVIKNSPWGNTYTAEMAKAALVGEQLGKGNTTDFLAISFSSTDYIGHQFGPNSIEVEDTYIRLDAEIASLLAAFDTQVGKENYIVFLTADHGAAHARGFMDEHRFPSEVFYHDSLRRALNIELAARFGKEYAIAEFINMQLYFNDNLIAAEPSKKVDVQSFIKRWFLKNEMVSKVVTLATLNSETLPSWERTIIENGYQQKRSGDMQVVFKSAILEEFPKGTTHGTGYNYDTQIPLVFYGWGIGVRKIVEAVYMTDIAPTIATLLHIQQPSGCVGKPIEDIFED